MSTIEFIQEERKNLQSKSFSKATFDKLVLTYLNDPEFESHIMKKKGDEAVKITTKPVKKFRKLVYNVLLDFGVSKDDAAAIMTTYKFKNKTVEGLYEFISDLLYQYGNTGRWLRLYEKEDNIASIKAIDVNEMTKSYRNPRTKEMGDPIRKKKHKKTVVKSSCPEWEKERLNKSGAVVRAMKKVAKSL